LACTAGLTVTGWARTEDDTAAFFGSVPGKEIAREEAQGIAKRLHARIYRPLQEIEGLRAEFMPNFLDASQMLESSSRLQNYYHIPEGKKFGFFEGLQYSPLVASTLFRDDGLSRAHKAVFYYGKLDQSSARTHGRATVLLYDKDGRQLNVGPAVGFNLGSLCLMHLVSAGNIPGVRTDPRENEEIRWRLHSPADGRSVLYSISRQTWHGNVHGQLGQLTYLLPDTPLYSASSTWTRDNRWSNSDRSRYRFSPLGDSGQFGVTQSPFIQESEWTQVGKAWVVRRSKTLWPYGGPSGTGMPTQITFTNFTINPPIPVGVLELPDAPRVAMDFSTPDAAAETVMNCLRTGRSDLLPYCGVTPPEKPVPTKTRSLLMPYQLEIYGEMHISEKNKKGDAWIFVIKFCRPFEKRDRACQIEIVPVGEKWKCKTENLAFTVYAD